MAGQTVTLDPEGIVGAYGTTVDHESFGVAVGVSEDSAAKIARLARAATRQEADLVVEVGGVAIGVLHPGTAKAMGRGITLSFDSREAFDAAAESMGSEATHVHEVSWENYREACRRFYSDDESGLARCLNPDEQREHRRRLREAEKMLDDPDADTDEILELLGVE